MHPQSGSVQNSDNKGGTDTLCHIAGIEVGDKWKETEMRKHE
jgi:hypothetical protein